MFEEILKGHPYTERQCLDAANIRFRYKQNFSLKNLYIMLHDWFIDEGWITRYDPEWPEPFFLLRQTSYGDEMWFWWRFTKAPNDSKYYRYLMDIFWHVIGSKDIEVMHQGKKFKTNSVDLEFHARSRIEMDYMHEIGKGWRDHWFLASVNDMFHKRMFKQELEKHKHDLYRETYRLDDKMKRFFKLRTFMPEEEGQRLWPPQGIGDIEGLPTK